MNGDYTEEDGFSDLKLVHDNPDSDVNFVLVLDTDEQKIFVEPIEGQDIVEADIYILDPSFENNTSIQPYGLPFLIPIGIALTAAMVEQLLALGAAILMSVTWG